MAKKKKGYTVFDASGNVPKVLDLNRTVTFKDVSLEQIHGIFKRLKFDTRSQPFEINGSPFRVEVTDIDSGNVASLDLVVGGSNVFVYFNLLPMGNTVDLIFQATERNKDFFEPVCDLIEQLIRARLEPPEETEFEYTDKSIFLSDLNGFKNEEIAVILVKHMSGPSRADWKSAEKVRQAINAATKGRGGYTADWVKNKRSERGWVKKNLNK